MELFKKLIMSLFPDTLFDKSSGINPANMFISFINARQFFSVVHRRVVEHYKLNFFDTTLDPFEIKIGFGDGHMIKPRDIEPYFAYCCVANINGYMMVTPVFQSTMIAFVCTYRLRKAFAGLSHYYFYALVMTIHHLSIIFISKIKQFPAGSDQERYQWFIELFFSTYEFVIGLHYKNHSKAKIKELKKQLLSEIATFFMLFYRFQKAQDLVILGNSTTQDFHMRLFQDEYQKNPTKQLLEGWMSTYADTVCLASLSPTEKEVANIVLPGDMQAKHMLGGKDIHLIVDSMLGELFETPEVNDFMTSFLVSGDRMDEFLLHISQCHYLRQKFFGGMKKYLNQQAESYPGEHDEEGDELISFVGSMMDIEQLIPESIKQESKSIERLINFFITLSGGMRIARGDGGYMRTYKRELLTTILSQLEGLGGNKPSAQYYYGLMLYNYSKNAFYYTYTYNHIKSGSDQFVIPSVATELKDIPSNYFILSMLDQHAIAGAFQEISPTYTKIYLKQTAILQYFKTHYSKKVGRLLKHTSTYDFINAVYHPLWIHLSEIPDMARILSNHLQEEDVSRIKDSLYKLDYRIVSDVLMIWYERHGSLSQIFTDIVIFNIVSTLKDTLLGIYLLYAYIHTLELKQQTSYHKRTLIQSLAGDLYNLSERDIDGFVEILEQQAEIMLPLMTKRTKTDDNKHMLQLGADNRIDFIDKKTPQQITTDIVGEDMMRLRGYLKNLTYYNRRYLISSM